MELHEDPQPESLTTGALCRKLRLTRSRIRRWVARGYIVPTYEWHRYQEWMHFSPEQVERARRLKWLCDDCGVLPSRAVERLEEVEAMEARREAAEGTAKTDVGPEIDAHPNPIIEHPEVQQKTSGIEAP